MSQAIARAGHGEAYVIPAPVAVDSAEIAEMLKKERNISAALRLARECQIALFGVGNLSRNTILYRSGSLKEEDFKSLLIEAINPVGYNMIVTPKEIDFVIDRLANVISTGINNALHDKVTHLKV